MRNIWTVLALTMVVGCGGGDGKDGADGAQGTAGPAGVNGKDGADGADGKDGAPGATGAPGAEGLDGTNGTNGTNGTDGADGADGGAILKGTGAPAASLGADGDLYIDTVSRDVYQKAGGAWTVITNLSGGPKGDPGANGTDGTDGTNGSSVRTGTGAPAAGLGALGDVYIDSATGDLYAKGAGGWTKTGSLAGPPGTDGSNGQDATDTVGGVRWFAFALTAAFADAPQLLTSETYTAASSAATFTFTGANQHGRLAFHTAGSFVPAGVNLSAFEALDFSATVTGGAVSKLVVVLSDGTENGCQWDVPVAGPDYSINLGAPSSCFPMPTTDFTLASVTTIQIGIVSGAVAGARTLTVDAIGLVDSN